VLDVERLLGRLAVGRECRATWQGWRASLREMPDLAASLEGCLGASAAEPGPRAARGGDPGRRAPAGAWSMKSRRVASLVSCARAFRPEPRSVGGKLAQGGRAAIAAMEAAEKQRTGIQSLKVRYNRVFGFYIEVTKANLHLVPQTTSASRARWVRSDSSLPP